MPQIGITVIDFVCSDTLDVWCVQEYCRNISVNARSVMFPFVFSHIYPNPVDANASIEYTVPKAGFVSIKIYDMSGREILTLVNEKKQKGKYKTEFQRKNLTGGTYLYRINVGTSSESKKFILK